MTVRILVGDCRTLLASLTPKSVQTCISSPPYWGLRDYGVEGQLGLERDPRDYLRNMVEVYRLVRQALRDDGTVWLNMGDSYTDGGRGKDTGTTLQGSRHNQTESRKATQRNGSKPFGLGKKQLVGMPWRLAFALQEDGWILRSEIIWHKPNPMPESVTDRPTKAHEYLFLLAKSERYYYDAEAIAEPRVGTKDAGVSGWASGPGDHNILAHNRQKGDAKTFRGGQYTNGNKFDNSHAIARTSKGNRPAAKTTKNSRSVWTIATAPFADAHFATFPPKLVEPCILAGAQRGGLVLDPFGGAGTTGLVADRLGRDAVLLELNPEYAAMARKRIDHAAAHGYQEGFDLTPAVGE